MDKLLSLCIPTYGISEWVFPVLDSIYNQKVDEDLFEVIVTDNGVNELFKSQIIEYSLNHKNLIYNKTSSYSFLNEIESYKLASGVFIKFINHRTIMLPGSIEYLLSFIKNNQKEKPFVYFTTGVLNASGTSKSYDSFDAFVKNLSYWSSWSTGMAFWKEDFDFSKKEKISDFNELFPHTDILFAKRNKSRYIIDDKIILKEIDVEAKRKGKYDLFYAFAVEFPSIILDLARDGSISFDSFNYIKKQNLTFITRLYYYYVKKKIECSYDLTSFSKSITIFYSKKAVKIALVKLALRKIFLRGNKVKTHE